MQGVKLYRLLLLLTLLQSCIERELPTGGLFLSSTTDPFSTKGGTVKMGRLYLYRVESEGGYTLFQNTPLEWNESGNSGELSLTLPQLYLPDGGYYISTLLTSASEVEEPLPNQRWLLPLTPLHHYLWYGEQLYLSGNRALDPHLNQLTAKVAVEIEKEQSYSSLIVNFLKIKRGYSSTTLNLVTGTLINSGDEEQFLEVGGEGANREFYLFPSPKGVEFQLSLEMKYQEKSFSLLYEGELLSSVSEGNYYKIKAKPNPYPNCEISIEIGVWSEIEEEIIYYQFEEEAKWERETGEK